MSGMLFDLTFFWATPNTTVMPSLAPTVAVNDAIHVACFGRCLVGLGVGDGGCSRVNQNHACVEQESAVPSSPYYRANCLVIADIFLPN